MTKRNYAYLIATVLLIAVAMVIYIIFRVGTRTFVSAKDFNLLVITLDTTRADHIGAYGYAGAQTPHLDRLAQDGVIFQNCYSPVPLTLPSHSSLFTGQYPLGHGVRANGSFFLDNKTVTLAEKFKELPQGYQTFAVISSFVLMSKFGLNQGFDYYNDSLKANELITGFDSEITAGDVYAKFERWFSKERKGKFFAWVHFYDPHTPYAAPKEYQDKFDNGLQGRYDAELAYTDHYLGMIIKQLEKENLIHNTLIVITSDHGEAFGEHNEFGHSMFCYQENIKVPLIFYNPALFKKGGRVSNRVSLVDIMPTLLEMYGLELPGATHGKSFVELLLGGKEDKQRTLFAESMHGKEEMGWAPLTAIIDGNYKYISLPQPELYDLKADKQEKENLFHKKNYLAKEMDKKLMRMVKASAASSRKAYDKAAQRNLTAGDKQHLQSLGYISAFSGKTASNLDPKKGILLKNSMEKIEDLIDDEKMDEAETQLKKMAQKDPENLLPQYFGSFNRIYKKRNQIQNLLDNWKSAIKKFPNNNNFRINLAFEYFHLNRLEESQNVADEILKINEKYTRALILKAKIKEKEKKIDDALALYGTAYRLEPENSSLALAYAKLLGSSRRVREAFSICNKILADETSLADVKLKIRLGILLTEIRKDSQALNLLSQVESQGKATAESLNYLGILKFRQGDYAAAEQYYQRSIAGDNRSGQPYNNLGTLYLTRFVRQKDRADHSRAMTAFNNALKLEPDLASALNGRASAFKFANRINAALKDWKQVIAIKPDFIDVYFNLAVTYLQTNNKKEALIYLNLCKDKFYNKLPAAVQKRLERLIREAGGST